MALPQNAAKRPKMSVGTGCSVVLIRCQLGSSVLARGLAQGTALPKCV